MTPLGLGLLTGMDEVDDPAISQAMSRMLATASAAEIHQTVVDLATFSTALCRVVADCQNTTPQVVLDCALAR